MPLTKAQQVLDLVKRHGVLRPRDLSDHGIPREYLIRLHVQGLLARPTRALYVLADDEPDENQGLVEACKRVPQGVICLLSALQFHHMTTQAPFEVWLAIPSRSRTPRLDYPPLRVLRFAPAALAAGVIRHIIRGVTVPVTDPATTVVDCFKFRNKIGLDVALEALRDCWKNRKATMDDIHRAAQGRRMVNVMRPYLESIT